MNTIQLTIASKSLTSASRQKVWFRLRKEADILGNLASFLSLQGNAQEADEVNRESFRVAALADAFCPKKKIRAW